MRYLPFLPVLPALLCLIISCNSQSRPAADPVYYETTVQATIDGAAIDIKVDMKAVEKWWDVPLPDRGPGYLWFVEAKYYIPEGFTLRPVDKENTKHYHWDDDYHAQKTHTGHQRYATHKQPGRTTANFWLISPTGKTTIELPIWE